MPKQCLGVVCLLLCGLALAAAAERTWYPPSEPSPFIPDDARWVATTSAVRTTHFRGTWTVAGPVRRAVVAVAPRQVTRLYLNGRLLAEAYSSHQATPTFVDVSSLLKPGSACLAARVYCEWGPVLYVQMRVEYADGTVQDFTTGADWQWCDQPSADWATNPTAGGDWQPVKDGGGYPDTEGTVWGHEFALLPRDLLQARFADHNARLQEEWKRPGPAFRAAVAPERPEWAAQFRDFARVQEQTGQLVDGAGRARHLFFTIYSQPGTLSIHNLDLDRLERDLDLMAKADIHLYMRMLGWNSLLTAQGEWAPLTTQPKNAGNHHFARAVDLWDYFVERARAHGRYIVFEGDFFWSANALVPAPYRTRYHLYPEVLEAQALATRKIISRYRECTNVLGMMIGEEDIVLEHDLDNPHQQALFAGFLKRKYDTPAGFRAQTPWGYDYHDPAAYVPGKWIGERWGGRAQEDVLVPRWQARAGVFGTLTDWAQVPLPVWPWLMDPEHPEVRREGCMSHNQFSPEDPLWIDFYEMREDELLFNMLVRWAQIVRQGMPQQLLFYSNAQDMTSSWHFLHLYRRAQLPFDVIGVGCHDAEQNLSEIPPWATVRKAIKVVSSYRPYALSPSSPARGIASGEGQGGHADQPAEVLNYFRGALFDEIGGGCAWTQTYAWGHICGADAGQEPHETPLLKWMGEFMPQVQGTAFPLRRPVQVLIVRNTNLAHSNMSGLDYANACSVAETLTRLNVEFDIVQDRDLVYRATPAEAKCKVDLTAYRLVILPSLAIDLPDGPLAVLDRWVHDVSAGTHVLALGWIGKRGPRLQPTSRFHPVVEEWLGAPDYESTVPLHGRQNVTLVDNEKTLPMSVDFGSVPPCGVPPHGTLVLRGPGGESLGTAVRHERAEVYAFGFPLGMAHEPLWGLEPKQQPRDALVPLFEMLARAAGVDRPVLAPTNLRVYVSGDGKLVLIRERDGLATDTEITLRSQATARGAKGERRLKVSLKPWEGTWVKTQ